jgi:hypothetical protein
MMKKILIALLALTFLVSMTGLSFANSNDSGWYTKWKSGASIKSDIKKNVKFKNEAEAESGCATALANTAVTNVNARTEAISDDIDSLAANDSEKTVVNTGNALAYSESADALNDVTNNEEERIKDNASSVSDVSVTVDSDVEGYGVPVSAGLYGPDGDHRNDSGCCPASVSGDIRTDVEFDNKAEAKTGNAFATGNVSETNVNSRDRALANDGGVADNDSDIHVTNSGEAVAYSETAVATNEAQNLVKIDILRNAESCKKVDVFAALTESFLPFNVQ